MKNKFLAIVKKVKTAGIAEALRATTNASEFNAVEQKFSEDYKELLEKIAAWAEEFKNSENGAIFNKGETIEDPMEIVIILRIINDEDAVSECEIFEEYQNLVDAIRDIGDEFSAAVAELADEDYICYITAEKIFNAIEDAREEALCDEEDADCGEESDADEADSDDEECDAAEGNDAEESGDENQEEAEPDESDDDGEAESEDDEEDADCGEESDADEADSDEAECDAAEADDAEESGDDNQEDAEPDESNDDGEAEPEDGEEDADCGDADEADSGINLAEAE